MKQKWGEDGKPDQNSRKKVRVLKNNSHLKGERRMLLDSRS